MDKSTNEVQLNEDGKVDWSKQALAIGVRLPRKADEDWTSLDLDDLKILHALLTKRIPKVGADILKSEGLAAIDYAPAAVEASNNLRLLAGAIASMIRWYERTGTKARD